MAADGIPGAKAQPQFLGTGAPATAVDLNLVAQYAADKAGEQVTAVANLPTAGNWPGREVNLASEKSPRRHDGTGWVPYAGSQPVFRVERGAAQTVPAADTVLSTVWGTPTTSDSSFFTFANGELTILKGGLYDLNGSLQLAAGSGNATVALTRNSVSAIAAAASLDVDARVLTAASLTYFKLIAHSVVLNVNDIIRICAFPSASIQAGNAGGASSANLVARFVRGV